MERCVARRKKTHSAASRMPASTLNGSRKTCFCWIIGRMVQWNHDAPNGLKVANTSTAAAAMRPSTPVQLMPGESCGMSSLRTGSGAARLEQREEFVGRGKPGELLGNVGFLGELRDAAKDG